MCNEIFSIGPFTVYGYGLMIAIGIMAAYFLGEYRAKGCGLDKEMVFGLVIWAVVFICLPTYIGKTGENTRFLAFFAMAGLLFVGGAPLVLKSEDRMQYWVHCGAAVVCAVCSQLVLVLNQPWLLLAWVPFVVAGFIIGWKRWRTMTFWAEMVCFANTFTFCLL